MRKQKRPVVAPVQRIPDTTLRPVLIKLAFVLSIGITAAVFLVAVGIGGTGESAGVDFGAFYTSGLMVVEGNGADVYEPDLFNARMRAATGSQDLDVYWFGAPPFFPLVMVPLTFLPFGVAYALFMLGGLVAFGWMASRSGLPQPYVALGLVVVSMPGYFTIHLGQTGMWVAALLLAVFLALQRGRLWIAGALLGLLAFKPFYAAGVGLWWLLRAHSFRRAILGSMCTVVVLAASGFIVPGGWSAYLDVMDELGGGFLGKVARSGVSLNEMWLSAVVDTTVATVLWLASALAVVAWFVIRLRTWGHRLDVALSLAVVVGLLISPRSGLYDLVLLAVPGVLLWRGYPSARPLTVVAGAWVFLVGALGWFAAVILDNAIGVYLHVTPIALFVIASWWLHRAGGLRSLDMQTTMAD